MKKAILAVLLALVLSLSPTISTKAALSYQHQVLSDATFALYGQLGDVRHFLCTAETYDWTKEDGYKLITAGHCVTGEDLPDGLQFFVAETADPKPFLMPVTVLKAQLSDKYDFAILQLKTDRTYPVLSLAPKGSSLSELETPVANVNFSEGITKEVVTGRVASGIIPNNGAEGDCSLCQGRFLVNIDNGPGASGSAIVDENTHQVIGLTEGGFHSLSGIAIVIPISLFWERQGQHETLPVK